MMMAILTRSLLELNDVSSDVDDKSQLVVLVVLTTMIKDDVMFCGRNLR